MPLEPIPFVEPDVVEYIANYHNNADWTDERLSMDQYGFKEITLSPVTPPSENEIEDISTEKRDYHLEGDDATNTSPSKILRKRKCNEVIIRPVTSESCLKEFRNLFFNITCR
jgi:hypothetical protein